MIAVGASTARLAFWQLASVLQDASGTRARRSLARAGGTREDFKKHLYLDVEHGAWDSVRRDDGLDGLAVGQDHGDLLAGGPARALRPQSAWTRRLLDGVGVASMAWRRVDLHALRLLNGVTAYTVA